MGHTTIIFILVTVLLTILLLTVSFVLRLTPTPRRPHYIRARVGLYNGERDIITERTFLVTAVDQQQAETLLQTYLQRRGSRLLDILPSDQVNLAYGPNVVELGIEYVQ